MMDGQEYLNQISASSRPEQESKLKAIIKSKFFLVGAIGLVALIIIMIIGAALGSGKGGEKNLSIDLYLHVDNTKAEIDTFQNDIKSSDLRSSSASLSGILGNTVSKMGDFLEKKYSLKPKNIEKKVVEQATAEKDALHNELFEAKITGALDRIFAQKMTYEISMIMAEENKIMKISKSNELKDALKESHDSLENLYNNFNDFSEGGKN